MAKIRVWMASGGHEDVQGTLEVLEGGVLKLSEGEGWRYLAPGTWNQVLEAHGDDLPLMVWR